MERTEFTREPLPARFCNLDRLLYALEARGLDGIVATTPNNFFYLSGFNTIGHKSDEPKPCAVILSRHAPEHPVLVLADYYLGAFLAQPSWIEDVRPFRAVLMGLDLPNSPADIDRFVPLAGKGVEWMDRARAAYCFDMGSAVRGAVKDLGLEGGRIAFDDMGFGFRLGLDGVEVADGYDPMMFARAVKTEAELPLIERATRLNQVAMERTAKSWRPGVTWPELSRSYTRAVAGLGGFVHDPGGMIWGHPRGAETTVTLGSDLEDIEIERGAHVMFDCHGTLDLYNWDGGKTWVVDGEPEGVAKRRAKTTAAMAEALLAAMKPGARISELQAFARGVCRKAGEADSDDALIFFHGLGLSHMDLEQVTADGAPNIDWMLEAGMVVPLHLMLPGGERERLWLEEVVVIEPDGGRPLFTWGFEPLTGS